MWFFPWYLFMQIVFFLGSGLTNGKATIPTIYVDPSGSGNFTTIQSAIDSVPSNNNRWICIRLKIGVYKEKVTIPSNKPYIILKGAGKRRTEIFWDDHDTMAQSPTFTVLADNFVAKSLSISNTYNIPWIKIRNGIPRKPAVAAMIAGDKCSFYRVGFFGVQDTLWDAQGRHYFKLCTIVGAVDFIFGAGQSIYERCSLSVVGEALENNFQGFITAQGRSKASDTNGFVFKECHVIGNGMAYLGRPWKDFAKVLYYNTTMENLVMPEGWYAENSVGQEHQLSFSEYDSHGAGANPSRRVSWEKKLSWEQVQELTSINFIDNEGWLSKQPF